MNENVIKMARLMVGCKDRTCEDCLSQSKKLFGSKEKCGLIEYATALHKAGYCKQSDTVNEFAEKVNEVIEACEMQDGYDAQRKTYGDIFEEFIQKIGCKNEISDYRQCIPFYGYPAIPNAVIVWLKDGSTLIYQTDTVEVTVK